MEQEYKFNLKPEKPKTRLNKVGITVMVLVVIIFLGAVVSSIYYNRKANADPNLDAQKQLERYTKMVAKHIVLPQGEVPTMATVSDPEKLKDQPFFQNAKKGDVVLIFADSRKAILYDPVNDRIVEVAPINATAGAPTANQ